MLDYSITHVMIPSVPLERKQCFYFLTNLQGQQKRASEVSPMLKDFLKLPFPPVRV